MDKILYSFEGMSTCQAAFEQKNYGLTSKEPINCKIIEEENSGLTSKKPFLNFKEATKQQINFIEKNSGLTSKKP